MHTFTLNYRNTLRTLLQSLCLFLLCCSSALVRAQSEVNVEKAGTLATLLPTSDSQLKISGSINGSDIKHLRKLINEGGVTSLDLSQVKIVSGGSAYLETYKTENDIIGQSMFTECEKLHDIVLPTTITAIQSNAFSRSGIRKVEIPNSVSRLGGDAFAYCNSLGTVVIGRRVSRLDQGVFYSSPVKNVFCLPTTPPSPPAYLFSSSPTIRVYTSSLDAYKKANWGQYGSLVGRLEKDYPMEEDSSIVVNNLREQFFEDAACTRLKADYATMADADLTAAMTAAGMPAFMTDIALKLKNNTWAAYEQDFRIHSYKAYSDAAYWNEQMRSTGGSYMGNPTGICSSGLEPLYVFVDEDVSADATLYLAGCVGNDLIYSAKTGTPLKRGLNIIDGQAGALYYVVYTADTRSRTKTLDQWPAIRIHIEGGTVNGYYDLTRHSDSDYQALLKAATHELFTIRGEQALFNFKRSTYKTLFPRTIDRSIDWFDHLTVWEKELMGFCESVVNGERAGAPYYLTGGEAIFPIYYNNPNFAIEGSSADAGYANSTPYRTCYNSVECIRNSFDVSRAEHDEWCSAHECGHNNQGTINLEGGTEVSNNLFSNYIRYLTGNVTSSGEPLSATMNDYALHLPYVKHSGLMRMYYQLYLYYHLAQKNTSFYPTLFQELRKDPLVLWNNTNNSALKFVRKVCEVAQEDLTDFFAAWGFFEPFTNLSVEDYGAHTLSHRLANINKTLAEISKYPKNRQILFVEDRVDYVLNNGFIGNEGKKRRESEQVGQCGDLGQFTSYLPENAKPSSYTYLQADSLYAMSGTGGVGFLMLDPEEQMVFAANAFNFCVPTSVGDNFTIYSVDADGTLHEVTKAGEGIQFIALEKAGTLPDALSAQTIKVILTGSLNGTDFKYLRLQTNEGNLASIDLTDTKVVSGGSAYFETNRTSSNSLGDKMFYNCRQLIAIRLPETITRIGSTTFANSGIKEITIPDNVTSVGGDAFAYCSQLSSVVIGSKMKTMAQGVFYNSPVQHAYVKALTPPSVNSYLFSSKPVIHVYASSLAAYKASAWADFGTIVGDLDNYDLTPVQAPRDSQLAATTTTIPTYDLLGRRVATLRPGTIYLRGGRKFIMK